MNIVLQLKKKIRNMSCISNQLCLQDETKRLHTRIYYLLYDEYNNEKKVKKIGNLIH